MSNPDSNIVIGLFVLGFLMFFLLIMAVIIAGQWMVFRKAGEPGWFALIPILNLYILVKISGKEWWWTIFFLLPILNLVATIVVNLALAAKFNKPPAFAVGLMFLPFIFLLILGFGDSTYQKS